MITPGTDDPDQPILDLDHRDVERSTTEVINQDGLVLALLETISDSRSRRLVQDGPHVQTGEPARVGRGLTLGRSEICGTRYHNFTDLVAQSDLGVPDDLAKDER